MLVVCDASPLIALCAIGRIDLLRSLFSDIWITDLVRAEIKADLPDWIQITTQYNPDDFALLRVGLDRGEASAIAFAMGQENATLIIDELAGRRVARELGIPLTGLVGVLLLGIEKNLIASGSEIVADLRTHGFWLSSKLERLLSDQPTP
ncbi:DUF3368 domain-containing protein [Neolewinella maritima]|uniref:DUF3368 domain-containing protein n=1 Tax=Neolewinella maritima TaxID=1383882 RepID=UPI001EE83064|nr:DUF3368 domain-containing protein [Neolewinella maritima]